jgi:ABC-type antimicrobial peptide transport system permease subunit
MILKTTSFIENFKMALGTLRNNKLRSFLTIFGVIIGVITVMLISSIISGITVAVEKQVESFGTNSISIQKYDSGIQVGRRSQEQRMRKPLTVQDAAALDELSSIETAIPILDVSNNFWGRKINVSGKNGKTSSSVNLKGTLPDFEKSGTEILVDGRWFSPTENDLKKDVILIGSSVAETYFPDILSGLTAPLILWLGFRKGKTNRIILIVWNILALGLLINIVTTAILSLPFPIQQIAFEQPNRAVLYFPFIWLPTVVVPLVLFSHLISLWQLFKMKSV